MLTILHIFLGLLGLSLIVLIHELGHFLAAKLCRVDVQRLCLFLGKPVLAWRWGRTEFAIAWLPLGGYCKMRDEGLPLQELQSDDKDLPTGSHTAPTSSAHSSQLKGFQEAAPLQKIFIAAAGPAINILFAVLVFFLFQLSGYPEIRRNSRIVVPTGITELSQERGPSPAQLSGLKSGDTIVSLAGQPITYFDELRQIIALHPGQALSLEFLRDGELQRSEITPVRYHTNQEQNKNQGQGKVGIVPWYDLYLQKLSSAAEKAGLKVGMQLIAVNGQKVSHWYGLSQVLRSLPQSSAPLKLLWQVPKSPDNRITARLSFEEIEQLEFVSRTWVSGTAPLPALRSAASELRKLFTLQVKGIQQLIRGRLGLRENLAGPLQISDQIGQVMLGSGEDLAVRWYNSWRFLAFISFMIALFNLLPLAVLDGGQILLYSMEFFARRRLPAQWIRVYQALGSGLVIALMLLVVSFELLHYMGV